ncbi:MAG: hypothetical protein KDG54_00155 [Geminicoccaceae bacterium]|nr:hypothetical protein [Geminicoccaceae bacterium]
MLRRALERRSVTYGELLAFFERRVTRITVAALCRDLGKVSERNDANGGPDLACLVVRKSDRLPGEGYFHALREEGSYEGPSTGPDAEAEIRRRQEAVFAQVERLAAAEDVEDDTTRSP